MKSHVSDNPCPCESGLAYPDCCGNDVRRPPVFASAPSLNSDIDFSHLSAGMQEAVASVNESPDLFPVEINLASHRVGWVKMSPFWYEESTFLDASRIMGSYAAQSDLQWLLDHTQEIVGRPAPVIFHTAFCGSTLLSRALSTLYNCLPLREPDVLGGVLQIVNSLEIDEQTKRMWMYRVFSLLSRRYEGRQPAVIKANDYACGLMKKLAESSQDFSQLFMYTKVEDFIASCLKDKGREKWISQRYIFAQRQSRKNAVFAEVHIDESDPVQMAVYYWSWNIRLYLDARKRFPSKLRSLCFSDFLSAPIPCVEACAEYFGLKSYGLVNQEAEMDALLSVYSKGDYAYSPQLRAQEISQKVTQYRQQIDHAITLALSLLGDDYPQNGLPGALTFSISEEPARRGILSRLFS